MSIQEVVRQFVRATGDYSLVDDPTASPMVPTDDCYFYLNAAQRFLDSSVMTHKSFSWFKVNTPASMFRFILPGCRAIEEVWWLDEIGETRKKLVRQRYNVMMREFRWTTDAITDALPVTSVNNADSSGLGTPLRWASVDIERAPGNAELARVLDTGHTGNEEDFFSGAFNDVGIIIHPAPAAEGVLRVLGVFHSRSLGEDSDQTFWTEVNPDLLVMAAQYKYDLQYRSFDSARTLLVNLNEALFGLAKDYSMYLSAGMDNLENYHDN